MLQQGQRREQAVSGHSKGRGGGGEARDQVLPMAEPRASWHFLVLLGTAPVTDLATCSCLNYLRNQERVRARERERVTGWGSLGILYW